MGAGRKLTSHVRMPSQATIILPLFSCFLFKFLMGNNSSMLGAQTPDQISKTKLLLENNVIGILANPRFRQEEFLSKFYHQPTPEIQKKYDSRQLCDLLIGCYEQIGNVDKMLETIIKNDQSEDNSCQTDSCNW